MSVNIYPEECKEEWRNSISTLLSVLQGRDRVVSSDMLARGCTHYVELMMTERKMKVHNPQMHKSIMKSARGEEGMFSLNEDDLKFVVQRAMAEGFDEIADNCVKDYECLKAIEEAWNQQQPKKMQEEKLMETDIPPQYAEIEALTGKKEAQDRSLSKQLHSYGRDQRKQEIAVPPQSNTGANIPAANKKGGNQKSKGAMGELPQPGDNDPSINWRGAYEDLHRSWLYQQSQINELTSRLSSFASKQLTDGNPNFTDLSDRNRPTKIGEKFGTVFDDEWSEAFEEMKAVMEKDDVCIDCLLNIVKLSFTYCEKIASQQLEALKNSMLIPIIHPFSLGQDTQLKHLTRAEQKLIDSATIKHAKEYRKLTAMASVQDICKKFFNEESLKKLLKDNLSKPKIRDYVERTTEHVWLMVVQDPPMYVEFADKGTPVNKELFRFYDKKGKIVERTIWPVVYLHKGGPVISKGYVYPQ